MMGKKVLTPLKSIRAKCLECSGSSNEVKLCPCVDCALWVYRNGHKPTPITIKQYLSGERPIVTHKESVKDDCVGGVE